MDKYKNCILRNMKLDVVNYLKHRTVCKSCHNRNRRKRTMQLHTKTEKRIC